MTPTIEENEFGEVCSYCKSEWCILVTSTEKYMCEEWLNARNEFYEAQAKEGEL